MNKLTLPLAVLLALGAASAHAQIVDSVAIVYSPRTGDTWIDTRLTDIDVYGRSYRDAFIEDVVLSYGAPRTVVRTWVVDRGYAPADVYYACAVAQQIGRPCVDVMNAYQKDRGQGWGVVAQRLGIKPGSPAFHALKGRVDTGHGKIKARGKSGSKPMGLPADRGTPADMSRPVDRGHGPPAGKGHDKAHDKDHGKGQGKGKDKDDKGKGKG